jgi:diadenosine tetraphosphate (Ap4A) HIT family hydrolase
MDGRAALAMTNSSCPLCAAIGGVLVFQGEKCRVIRAEEAGFPAFYRVVWTQHAAEFSDLSLADRSLCMAAVNVVELALRAQLQPTKINLAALGNVVPHLHWHVIARFDWDSHFPAPVWAAAQRPVDSAALAVIQSRLGALDLSLQHELSALVPTL